MANIKELFKQRIDTNDKPTPTDVQIGALKQLARYYGDHGLASTCDDALDGNREALEVVADEIASGGWL